MKDEKVMPYIIGILLVAILIMVLFFAQGCQPTQNGGMELSPAGEVAVSVASLYVPEPYRTIGLILLGSGIGGGTVAGVNKLRKKKK